MGEDLVGIAAAPREKLCHCIGREGGQWSHEVFLEPKNVCVSYGTHPIPHWGR